MAGCTSPDRRVRQHPEAFHRLSVPDQKLVLGGHVRPGLSQDGVYIAWGEPDRKTTAADPGKDGAGAETWIYRQRITLYEPMSSYDHFGPNHGYGDLPPEPWLRPGYGIGGIGNEGLLQYQPNVRNLDTLRIAVFRAGKLDRYKSADGTWSQAGSTTFNPEPVAVKPTPAVHTAHHSKVGTSRHRASKEVAARGAKPSGRHAHKRSHKRAAAVKKRSSSGERPR